MPNKEEQLRNVRTVHFRRGEENDGLGDCQLSQSHGSYPLIRQQMALKFTKRREKLATYLERCDLLFVEYPESMPQLHLPAS